MTELEEGKKRLNEALQQFYDVRDAPKPIERPLGSVFKLSEMKPEKGDLILSCFAPFPEYCLPETEQFSGIQEIDADGLLESLERLGELTLKRIDLANERDF